MYTCKCLKPSFNPYPINYTFIITLPRNMFQHIILHFTIINTSLNLYKYLNVPVFCLTCCTPDGQSSKDDNRKER